jgi:hypothetical protein
MGNWRTFNTNGNLLIIVLVPRSYSRVLNFLKGQDELEIAAEDLEEDDLLVTSQKSRKKKNTSERNNAFDVVS